jgi:hypothetical protein
METVAKQVQPSGERQTKTPGYNDRQRRFSTPSHRLPYSALSSRAEKRPVAADRLIVTPSESIAVAPGRTQSWTGGTHDKVHPKNLKLPSAPKWCERQCH